MQHAMQHGQPSGLQRVAQLLSGHQLAAAAVLAASMGDVRLASLIAQVTHQLTVNLIHGGVSAGRTGLCNWTMPITWDFSVSACALCMHPYKVSVVQSCTCLMLVEH